MPLDTTKYLQVSYLSVKAWLSGVGSHPLGHDLVYVGEPDSLYTGWACKTCRCYLGIQREELMRERYWVDAVQHQIQKNPDQVLYEIQQGYRGTLTLWERLLFDSSLEASPRSDSQE